MKLSTSILAFLTFAAAGTANATLVVASDNFDSASTGWNSAWTLAQGTRTTPPPASIKQSGASSALVIAGNSDNTAVRTLETRQNSDVFVDFTLKYSGILGGNDFVGLWFGNFNGPNIGLKANCGITTVPASCTNDLFVRTSSSGGTYLLQSDIKAGETYTVSGHLYKSGKNGDFYDRFDAWFKPSSADVASSIVTAQGKSIFTSFNSLGFRSANIDKGVTVSIDNLRVGNVPEPGSLALMGLAFAGFAAARRRKRG
jgi:hypothetical protein